MRAKSALDRPLAPLPSAAAATHAGNHKACMAEEQGRSPSKLTACWQKRKKAYAMRKPF
jgi:hypothetical protein